MIKKRAVRNVSKKWVHACRKIFIHLFSYLKYTIRKSWQRILWNIIKCNYINTWMFLCILLSLMFNSSLESWNPDYEVFKQSVAICCMTIKLDITCDVHKRVQGQISISSCEWSGLPCLDWLPQKKITRIWASGFSANLSFPGLLYVKRGWIISWIVGLYWVSITHCIFLPITLLLDYLKKCHQSFSRLSYFTSLHFSSHPPLQIEQKKPFSAPFLCRTFLSLSSRRRLLAG